MGLERKCQNKLNNITWKGAGMYTSTKLNYNNSDNPAPDYYKSLPSSFYDVWEAMLNIRHHPTLEGSLNWANIVAMETAVDVNNAVSGVIWLISFILLCSEKPKTTVKDASVPVVLYPRVTATVCLTDIMPNVRPIFLLNSEQVRMNMGLYSVIGLISSGSMGCFGD